MPKMETAGITRQISLEKIIDTGNIREQYNDIEDLAESIKKNGQLQPVIVKRIEGENGEETFELIAGYRRRAAFQYLCEHGDNFNSINATVVTGDKLTLQLVENIQRSDLTAKERERAIYQMLESGLKQNEIAARLSKKAAYVSIHVSAFEMRIVAEKNNIDLSGVETSTLSELLGIPSAALPELLKELVNFGGTRSAAKQLVRAYKDKMNPSLDMEAAPAELPEEAGDDLNIDMDSQPPDEPSPPAPQAEPGEESAAPAESPEPGAPEIKDKKGKGEPAPATAEKSGKAKPKAEPDWEPIEPEHAYIDVNIILTGIYAYIDGIKKSLPEKGIESLTENAKIEAANDVIALIHERLENA
ncbi:hypothetical protein FACS189447_07670 [Spirochaetia bacterium]|nr:hypothetical protein FACS189447_07670 [Spirochaetia bacterium]